MSVLTRYANNPVFQPPLGEWEKYLTLEPSILREAGVFKMIYTGFNRQQCYLGYATSLDGKSWERHATREPIIGAGRGGHAGQACCSNVIKVGSTYHCYFTAGYFNGTLMHAVASDMAGPWQTVGQVLPPNAYNNSVIIDSDGTWKMLIEGFPDVYRTRLATSPDGYTWSIASGYLESLRFGTGMYGGPCLRKINGVYHVWYHASTSGILPTFLAHAHSTDLLNWTKDPDGVFLGLNGETFPGGPADQYADPEIIDLGNEVYLYYDVDRNDSIQNGADARIDLAIFNGTLAEFVAPSVPPPPLFEDNFDGLPSPAWSHRGGVWEQSNGIMKQHSLSPRNPSKLLLVDQNYPQTCEIKAKVRVDSWVDGGWTVAGVGLRANTTDGKGYNLVFCHTRQKVSWLNDWTAYGNQYAFNWSVGVWYWFRMRIEGSTLMGKIWADGTGEPSSWQFTQLGWTSRPSGPPNLVGGSTGEDASNSTVSFDDVTVRV